MADPRAVGGKEGYTFVAWAKHHSCQPEFYFEPEAIDQIRAILECATRRGKKVTMVGSGHSPSDIACTTDYMISLRRYNKLVKVDTKQCTVTVQGGMTLGEMIRNVLHPNNMAVSVFGSTTDQSIAGLISTGTHGTGKNFGIISSYVLGVELMTSSGEILVINKEENSDLLPAAQCSLGALGVILNVTLQCELDHKLCKQVYPDTLDNVLDNLESRLSASEHFRFLWYPHTDGVVVSHTDRTDKDIRQSSPSFWTKFVEVHCFEFCLWIGTFLTFMVPTICHLFYNNVFSQRSETVERGDMVKPFIFLDKQYVMDWAIPREHTVKVLREIQKWVKTTNFPAHAPCEVRFVKQDNIYLSPAYGRDTCYLNPTMYRPYWNSVDIGPFWEAIEEIVLQVDGRPHWAKDHRLRRSDLEKLYPRWNTFCEIRQRLDPNRLFLNNYLERVFGK